MTYIWYAQLTATSGGLITTIQKSFFTVPRLLSEDNRSSDTSAALLFAGGKTQADIYQAYMDSSKNQTVKTTNPMHMPQLTSDSLPFTTLGRAALAAGIHPESLANLRQDFAKLLQGLAIAGVIFITYGWFKNRPSGPNFDLVSVNLAGLLLLAALVVLPVLSVNYGLLRAFQQELIFLLIPIVLLFSWAARHLRPWVATVATTSSVVFIFLLFTGVFAQILGGNSPGANLNNAGLYYGLYYSSAADRRAFQWIQQHIPATTDVRAANFNRASMYEPGYAFSKTGILPSQIASTSYVYLDATQIRERIFYVYYDSSPLVVTFPLEYYDHTRDQIYSSGSAGIYQ